MPSDTGGTGDTVAPDLGLSPELLAIIVCPSDHGDLDPVPTPAGGELVCRSCGLAYPVRDGIAVLLVDEARRSDRPGDEAPDRAER